MISGVLLAESLRPGAVIEVPGLLVRSIRREDVSASTTDQQPDVWTILRFEAPAEAAEALTAALSSGLAEKGGWYADFTVGDEHVVVFAGRVFRYTRGDAAGKEAAKAYGRSAGVPEQQLDWEEFTAG